jgi:hypothetical protein
VVPIDRHASAEVRRETEGEEPLVHKVKAPTEEMANVVPEVMTKEWVLSIQRPEHHSKERREW